MRYWPIVSSFSLHISFFESIDESADVKDPITTALIITPRNMHTAVVSTSTSVTGSMSYLKRSVVEYVVAVEEEEEEEEGEVELVEMARLVAQRTARILSPCRLPKRRHANTAGRASRR